MNPNYDHHRAILIVISPLGVCGTLDLSILMMPELESTATLLLTSTIMRTVGSVVDMFWGWGGRIVTGTTPITWDDNHCEVHCHRYVHGHFLVIGFKTSCEKRRVV